jgi:hypothetical protein
MYMMVRNMHNTYHTLYTLHIESHRIDILRDKVMASLDEFVAEMGAYADEIVIDSGAVEIDLEEETEFEFKDRLINLLQKSVDGNDLFVNCLANFPNSCKFFGLTLSMNRAIKSMISQSKLPAEASVGWKKLPPSMKVTLQSNFQSLLKGSKEWNALISILLKFEKPKATKKSFRVPTTQPLVANGPPSLLLPAVKTSAEEDKSEPNRVLDRIALLASALVDPNLLEMWRDIAAPIPACERPAGILELEEFIY